MGRYSGKVMKIGLWEKRKSQKWLKDRDSKEKEWQNRRSNIIIFELPESKKN